MIVSAFASFIGLGFGPLMPTPVKPIDFEADKLFDKVGRFYSSLNSLKINGRSYANGHEEQASAFVLTYEEPHQIRVEGFGKTGKPTTYIQVGDTVCYTDVDSFSLGYQVPGITVLKRNPLCGLKEKISSIEHHVMVGSHECDEVDIGDFEFQRTMRKLYIGPEGALWRVESASLTSSAGIETSDVTEVTQNPSVPTDTFAFPMGSHSLTWPPDDEDNRWKGVYTPLPVGSTMPELTAMDVVTNQKVSLSDLMKGKKLLVFSWFCLH